MKNKLLIISICMLYMTSCATTEDKVIDCFKGYKKSILSKNGESAYKFIDQNTKDYYEEILNQARTANALQIDYKTILDQIMIISLRHRMAPNDLKSFDSKELFIWAVDNGMIGKESVKNIEIKNVKVVDNSASADLYINNRNALFKQEFNLEDNEWKIDLTSIFPLSERELIRMSGKFKYRRDFINGLVEQTTGKKVNPRIWNGMIE